MATGSFHGAGSDAGGDASQRSPAATFQAQWQHALQQGSAPPVIEDFLPEPFDFSLSQKIPGRFQGLLHQKRFYRFVG